MRARVRELACALALCALAGAAAAAPPAVSASAWMNSAALGDPELANRVVLLDFWATWCMPCVRNLATMQSYAESFKDKPFTLIGVHYSETHNVELYLRDQGVQFPVAIDSGDTFKRFAISVIPTYILIDKQGKIRSTTNEPPPKEKIAALLAE